MAVQHDAGIRSSMWIWVGPRWMRPGGRVARAMWFVSLPVAAAMIGVAWWHLPRRTPQGVLFLVVWTLLLLGIVAFNFRTMYLARGRRAERILQALDEQDRADATTATRPA